MVKSSVLIILAAVLFAAAAIASEFAITFEWGDIPHCTTGRPNVVPNPRFLLSNVPAGTKFIEFAMTDLDVPSYNHGGGTVAYTGQQVIEPGAFTYKSPCPPGGAHKYQWEAKAKAKTGFFSGSIDKAISIQNYP